MLLKNDDIGTMRGSDGDASKDDLDSSDTVCAICDNGGHLLICEGRCMRSFHATKEHGEESKCRTLGMTKAEVDGSRKFLCKNCKYNRHQCFACRRLGVSDKSTEIEVFNCGVSTCGHFYHPKCVANLLFPGNEREASESEQKIAAGEPFTCPVHRCQGCKLGENRRVKELQFAVCRHCPRSYHRGCLPRKIAFKNIEEKGILQRAWDELIPNRILLYCLKHRIIPNLKTPRRNHIKFPKPSEREDAMDMQSTEDVLGKRKRRVLHDDLREDSLLRKPKKTAKVSTAYLPAWKESSHFKGSSDHRLLKRGRRASSYYHGSRAEWHKRKVVAKKTSTHRQKVVAKKMPRESTQENISEKQIVLSTQPSVTRNTETIKAALQILANGGTLEEARKVCQPYVLYELLNSNMNLVYLAPFLHGMRSTLFGRNFLSVEKLQEIVNMLQLHVQNGDMVVDFCCGDNEFSRLMKERLHASGKTCSFKNYDVVQPEHNFNFVRKDWMEVQPEELYTGSKLIIGLAPPFGVDAALANSYINKALTLKPKLLVLVVPKETQRLDQKQPEYDLIWKCRLHISGEDMRIEQWDLKPPSLYLWSRPDWTEKHRAIAFESRSQAEEGS